MPDEHKQVASVAEIISEDMINEYKTLRDEILQLYREQVQLAFASTLPLFGGVILAQQPSIVNRWLFLTAGIMLLCGITFKIVGNYYRIFLIGSYLSVIHERQGKSPETFSPGPTCPGWHTRWRKIDNNPVLHPELKGIIGNASARGDAAFIGATAIALIAFTVGADIALWITPLLNSPISFFQTLDVQYFIKNAPTVTGIFTSLIALTLLRRYIVRLWFIQRYGIKFKEEWEAMVAKGSC